MKKQLRKSEIKELISKLKEELGIENLFSAKDKVEISDEIISINGRPMFFYKGSKIIPTLKMLVENNILKKITVDMGAVGFMAKGADLMRPGIVAVDQGIDKEEFVSIIDETHSKPIAVGITIYSGQDIEKMSSGKVVNTIHHIGDEIWKS